MKINKATGMSTSLDMTKKVRETIRSETRSRPNPRQPKKKPRANKVIAVGKPIKMAKISSPNINMPRVSELIANSRAGDNGHT
jgi:hypothetical protein